MSSTWIGLAYTACIVAVCAVPLSAVGYLIVRIVKR